MAIERTAAYRAPWCNVCKASVSYCQDVSGDDDRLGGIVRFLIRCHGAVHCRTISEKRLAEQMGCIAPFGVFGDSLAPTVDKLAISVVTILPVEPPHVPTGEHGNRAKRVYRPSQPVQEGAIRFQPPADSGSPTFRQIIDMNPHPIQNPTVPESEPAPVPVPVPIRRPILMLGNPARFRVNYDGDDPIPLDVDGNDLQSTDSDTPATAAGLEPFHDEPNLGERVDSMVRRKLREF